MTGRAERCRDQGHHRFRSVRESVGADVVRFARFHPDYRPRLGFRTKLSILLQPTLLCLATYRFAHYLWVRGWHGTARTLASLNTLLHKANIPAESCIGPGCFLGHSAGSSFIGSAGSDLTLFSLATCCPEAGEMGGAIEDGPYLGDRVTVGGHATLVGRLTVGDDVRIAPKTWIAQDCPDGSLVVSARLRHRVVPGDATPPDQITNAR